jgi:hypothetical protein
MSSVNKLTAPSTVERKSCLGIPLDTFGVDIEQSAIDDAHLINNTVRNFIWSEVTVTVKDRQTKAPKDILDKISGYVRAGKPRLCTMLVNDAHYS